MSDQPRDDFIAPLLGAPTAPSPARAGWVYLVGAGPGDPGLLTLRGAELLQTATVVLHDELVEPALLEHVSPLARVVSVGKRGDRPEAKAQKQAAINAEMVALAGQGEAVVRLKGGDPFVFGRVSEELHSLRAAAVPYQVVPGICSPVAAGAYAGIALTDRVHASSVTFVTAVRRDGSPFDWGKLRQLGGTLCIFMGRRALPKICRGLMIDAGLDGATPAAAVQWISRPQQRVVQGTLSSLPELAAEANLGTPSLIFVGETLQSRKQLSWFDAQPLFGQRVLVTRPQHQVAAAALQLRRVGAAPVAFPTIAINPPVEPERVTRAIEEMGRYQLVVFTSTNGVHAFFAALRAAGKDARVFGGSRIATIGPATAAALHPYGLRPDIVAKTFVAEGLVAEILGQLQAPCRVLIPRAMVARELLPDALREAGMEVTVVPVYQTVTATPEKAQQLRALLSNVDSVMLTSSSTVEQLVMLLGEGAVEALSGCQLASIGPITTATAQRLGLKVAVTATVSTVPGLIDAMVAAAS